MGIIIKLSKHVVYELLTAVKKGLQAKKRVIPCLYVSKMEGFAKGNRMFGVPCSHLFVGVGIHLSSSINNILYIYIL